MTTAVLRSTWSPRLRRAAGALACAAGALLLLRYVFPSRLEGVGGGVRGFLAELGDRHPLLVALVLFVTLAEIGRYWLAMRAGAEAATPVAPRSLRRLVVPLVVAALAAFASRSSLLATFSVVGPSMLPTLEPGDRVLVSRAAYGLPVPFAHAKLSPRVPARGDLVVFHAREAASAEAPQSWVKRVIGLPGDTVAFRQGGLLINGWAVPSCDAGPYVGMQGRLTVKGRLTIEFLGDRNYLTVRKPLDADYPEYVVKPGEVYVVGDDRGVSSDSRLWNEGRGAGVPVDALEGRVSRVLLGAVPDGRLDFSRLLAPPLDLEVRLPGVDMSPTRQRIRDCLKLRPAVTSPPAAKPGSGAV